MGRIKNIDGKVDKILEAIDNKVIYKAKKYDETMELLNKLQFSVDIKPRVNELGEKDYNVTYSIKTTLRFDADGDLEDNDVFRSINLLNLVNNDSMVEFLKIIENEKKNKKVK